ncbi:MAG: TrbC/VirB2 family protein [Patescibacteria group bacterium]
MAIIKSSKKFLGKITATIFTLFAPILAFAQGYGGTPGAKLQNPLKDINDIPTLIVAILDVVVKVGGYIAVLALIYAGFMFVKARGNREELETAKRSFFYIVIGVAVLLAAKAISLGISATISNIVR